MPKSTLQQKPPSRLARRVAQLAGLTTSSQHCGLGRGGYQPAFPRAGPNITPIACGLISRRHATHAQPRPNRTVPRPVRLQPMPEAGPCHRDWSSFLETSTSRRQRTWHRKPKDRR